MFKKDDIVKLKSSNMYGKIIRITNSKLKTYYTVMLNNQSKISTTEDKIELYEQANTSNINKKINTHNVSISYNINNDTNFNNEIMIRHQTVLEALHNVDIFISSAIVNKEKRIKIIHGRHGGILRNAVHEYLKNSPYVESYKLADEYEGSIGVTIVYLK